MKIIRILIAVSLLLGFTAIIDAAVVNYDNLKHYSITVGLPHAPDAMHIVLVPSLTIGTGSNDFVIGPFDITNLGYFPTSVNIGPFFAQTWSATNDDVEAYLIFETKGPGYGINLGKDTANFNPISTSYNVESAGDDTSYTLTGAGTTNFMKIDSAWIDDTNDSAYTGMATGAGTTCDSGQALVFQLPPHTTEWRLYWAADGNADSLQIIDMFIIYGR